MKNLIVIYMSAIFLCSFSIRQNDKTLNKTKKEFKTSVEVVEEIVFSSPVFKKRTLGLSEAVIKNGGTGFGTALTGSPNPQMDKAWNYSKTYDFGLYESYPSRMVTIVRFTFDPIKRQLYELDVVTNTLNPIDFDKTLLILFNELYK